jgi:hypothetical protein
MLWQNYRNKGGMIMKSHAMKRAVLAWGVVAFLLFLTSGPALAHQITTTSNITINPNPATDGDTVAITGSVAVTGTQHPAPDPLGGKIQIQECMSGGVGVPAANCSPNGTGTWTTLNGSGEDLDQPGENSTTVNFDTTGLGGSIIGFRSHYVPGGGAHVPAESTSPAVDLVINAASSCSGVNVGATLAAGNGTPNPGDSGPWTFRISVENCTGVDLTDVKVQGGTSGWTTYGGFSVPDGTVTLKSMPKKTQVLTWIVDIANGQTKTIDVTVNGTVPCSAQDGQILFISGPWSAVFDDGSGPQKSDYSGRVSLTVDGSAKNPSCP